MTAPVSPPDGDWITQLLDRLDALIAMVRDRTTAPLAKVGRVVVYGILIATMGAIALILGVIVLGRLLDIATLGHIWIGYAVLGGLSTFGGMIFWRRAVGATK